MKFLKKLFHLPTPVELGHSKINALPMDAFDAKPEDYTWEKWHQEVKSKHPIKYFFGNDVPQWWRVHVGMNVEHFFYWLRTNTYNRYHKLDLRQPNTGTSDDYRWGWIDEDHQLLFACFNILVSHVEVRNSAEYNFGVDEKGLKELQKEIEKAPDEWQKKSLENQLEFHKDLAALYKYWTVERKTDLEEKDRLLSDWSKHRSEDKAKNDTTRWDAMQEFDRKFDEREDEMLMKLIKIRRSMWT